MLPDQKHALTTQARLAQLPAAGLPLREPVRVWWNDFLVPFIEAQNDDDLFTALGVIHAHLRLSQMEILRRAAEGRISEMAGPFTVDLDHSLKLLNLGQAAAEIKARLEPETFDALDHFLSGINFYQRRMTAPPPDLRLMGIGREPWSIEDIITVARLAGADVNWLMWAGGLGLLEDPHWAEFWERLKAVHKRSAPSFSYDQSPLSIVADLSRSGSNVFALSGRLTKSGGALLAGDPHVGFQLPSLWLLAGLKSPSYHVLGFMFPGVPVVVMGRNEKIAWGATNMRSLSSSLYRLGPQEERQAWREEHEIRVRWWFPKVIRRRMTRFGPIVSDSPHFPNSHGPTLALRWVGHEPTDEIGAFLKLNRASNWEEFQQAFRGYGVSGQNYMYADRAGNIGQLMAVKLPRYQADYKNTFLLNPNEEWEGYETVDTLPKAYNPPIGFLVSSNNAPIEHGFAGAHKIKVGLYYSANDRYQRISSLLLEQSSNAKMGSAQAQSIQTDVCAPSARTVSREMLLLLSDGSTQHESFLAVLRAWNGCYERASRGALAFTLLQYHFVLIYYPRKYGERIAKSLLSLDVINDFLLEDLESDDRGAHESLREAVPRAAADFFKFRDWGDFHRLTLAHPLARVPLIGRRFSVGEYQLPGSLNTVWKTAHSVTNERHTARYGATARHIHDLSDPDENYFVLLGGQDGYFGSVHFNDQTDLWAAGKYLKVPFEIKRVRETFRRETLLLPQERS